MAFDAAAYFSGLTANLVGFLVDPKNLPAIGATVVSMGSAVSAMISQGDAKKKAAMADLRAKQAEERANEAHERMKTVQAETLQAGLNGEIMKWGTEAIELFAEAQSVMESRGIILRGEAFAARVAAVQARVSAAVDKGRLYFPNDSADLIGLERPFANRGYRPPILDALVLAFEELRRVDREGATPAAVEAGALFQARRAFVSELQRTVDPRRRQYVLENLKETRAERQEKDEVSWEGVAPVVEKFEERFGKGAFWADRPRPRSQIQADMFAARDRTGG